MDNKFFTFLDPVLRLIDNGSFYRKPISVLYMVLSVLNLLIPIVVLVQAINGHIFDMPGRFIFTFIVLLLVIAVLSWFGAMIWWNRYKKVDAITQANDEFVAIPIISHLIQTTGEWLGMWVGVGGFIISLLASIILGDNISFVEHLTGLNISFFGSFLMILYGFMIVIIFRSFAELYRAIVTIANNTKKLK